MKYIKNGKYILPDGILENVILAFDGKICGFTDKANKVITEEFPQLAKKCELHIPDEKSRRVGQSVAAASLPKIK